MNVVYSSSDSYSPVAGVSLFSLLENNQSSDELNVFIIDNNISDKNKEKFIKTCNKFGRKLTFIPIANIEKMAGTSIDTGRWNISTFARLFYATLLPNDVEKVIHIDCDTMVMTSLEEFWNTDMEGKIVAGSLECIGDNYKTEIGLSKDDTYINAGNIMLNLKKIREDNTEELFKKFLREHRQLSFVDQPVLNGCVKNSEKLVVPLNFNAYSIIYYLKYNNLKRAKRVSQYYSEAEVKDAVENPWIVHFTTCFMDGSRPWIENNSHPLLGKYLDYRRRSEWGGEPLWKDSRGTLKRAAYKIFRILPQSFVAFSIGFIHNGIIPLMKKIKK